MTRFQASLDAQSLYESVFFQAADKYSTKPAILCGQEQLSYAQLLEQVNNWRQRIQTAQLVPGQAIALLADKRPPVYAMILACLAEGHPWLPLHGDFPAERNARMLDQADAGLLFVDLDKTAPLDALIANLPAQQNFIFYQPEKNLALIKLNSPKNKPITHQDQAYILFTSGSTGTPKGIAVSRENLAAYLTNFRQLYPIPQGLRFSQVFALTFDLSVHDLFVCWQSGGCLVIPTAADLLMPLQYIRREQIQVWFSVPTMANLACQSGLLRPQILPSLEYSFFCGEALPVSSAVQWQQAAPSSRLVNLYGPTEATIAITAHELSRTADANWQHCQTVPIGEPYPQQQAIVINEQGQPAALGESGELWLAGSQLTPGYLLDSEKTAAVFVSARFPGFKETRWYRSGDRCKRHPEFGLLYLGRMDRQIKICGYRVELQEVEHCLRQITGIESVAVVAILSADKQIKGLCGFISASRDTTISEVQIKTRLAEKLPAYMQLEKVIIKENLPTNSNGKIDYPQLSQEVAIT